MLSIGVIRGSNFNDVCRNQIDALESSDDGAKFSRTPAACLWCTGRRRNYGGGKWLAVDQSTPEGCVLKPARASPTRDL